MTEDQQDATSDAAGEKMDYWCVVALNYARNSAWLMAESQHCIEYSIIDDSDVSDLWNEWIQDRPPGLYRLTLTVDDIDDVEVDDVELLFEFPPIRNTKKPDFLNITKDVILEIDLPSAP